MQNETSKIGKHGGDLWFRIPAAIVKGENLKPGEEVQFVQVGEHEFVLVRVCTDTGANKRILTLGRAALASEG